MTLLQGMTGKRGLLFMFLTNGKRGGDTWTPVTATWQGPASGQFSSYFSALSGKKSTLYLVANSKRMVIYIGQKFRLLIKYLNSVDDN
uniref:Uncharacterized protein n=1 Tax=Oryza meridionalis TaxID=40149 RepID=A0A0E0E4H1_9ORYZ